MKKDKDKKRDKPVSKPSPEKPVNEPKPHKLRSKNIKTMIIMRNIVLALALCIFVMGVFVIIRLFANGDGTETVREEIYNNTAAIRSEVAEQAGAKAFAQSFIKDYFTYQNRDINEYRVRLERYCTPRLAGEMLENVMLKESANAVYVQAVDVSEYGENQYDITVVADVIYTKPQAAPANAQGFGNPAPETLANEESKKTFYLVVPVWSNGQGGYAIEDIPMFTAPGRAYEYEREAYSGKSADEADMTMAKQMLNDFFKTLYSEPQNKIDYYLADNADKQKFTALELNGSMMFQRIENLALYNAQAANEYITIVVIKITDSNGTEIRQRFNMELVKKDKFYAKNIHLRTYNLKM